VQQKKTVVLGITGGIAAYKIADLASKLAKEGFDVQVIMTKNATEFITPLTFETLTGNRCIIDTFARDFEWDVKHVALAKKAAAMLIAPATANVIAKMAAGIADDMLTTTVLAMRCPVIVAPAMNTAMYENPITQRNISTLREYGYHILEPDSGVLACKDVGKGRLVQTDVLYSVLLKYAVYSQDLAGKHVLVTAGPTQESLDPVRYLTNHSTGKMGYEIAKAAWMRGAQVTLISGPTALEAPFGVKRVSVVSAQDMFEQVKVFAPNADYIVKAAAVADFTFPCVSSEKIKKGTEEQMSLSLTKTEDILGYLGTHKKDGQILCGFSMETQNLIENSRQKLKKKHADMIVANNLKDDGAGFGVDTNVVTMITVDDAVSLPVMAKSEVAHRLLDQLIRLNNQ
jgi:phosphopantothenoylcysteine decarboxylase/phosphopantothenate--cysteine ligase